MAVRQPHEALSDDPNIDECTNEWFSVLPKKLHATPNFNRSVQHSSKISFHSSVSSMWMFGGCCCSSLNFAMRFAFISPSVARFRCDWGKSMLWFSTSLSYVFVFVSFVLRFTHLLRGYMVTNFLLIIIIIPHHSQCFGVQFSICMYCMLWRVFFFAVTCIELLLFFGSRQWFTFVCILYRNRFGSR